MKDKNTELRDFLHRNKGRKIIVVQGLGFVGSVMSLVCANPLFGEHCVIGVDLPTTNGLKIIKSLNSGVFPLNTNDPDVYDLYQKTRINKNFLATCDKSAYEYADIIIVDINLDVEKFNSINGNLNNYDVSMSNFKNAINDIASRCKKNILLLLESTVPPGTCQNIIKPIFKRCFKSRSINTSHIAIGHSYERVMPGKDYVKSIRNYYRVYSGINRRSEIRTKKFLETIIYTEEFELTKLENTTSSELAKVLENSFRAVNIAFMVEWSRFAEISNVNLYDVVNAIRKRPTHKNLMYPGVGVGGYCLPKDSLLAEWASVNLFSHSAGLPYTKNAISINDQMPFYAYNYVISKIKSLRRKSVGIMGVSYRQDVGDTRYSPVYNLYKFISNETKKIIITDPYVQFWDEMDKLIETNSIKFLNKKIDVLIIATAHNIFSSKLSIKRILSKPKMIIFDLVGLFSKKIKKQLESKHKVYTLGVGEIEK